MTNNKPFYGDRDIQYNTIIPKINAPIEGFFSLLSSETSIKNKMVAAIKLRKALQEVMALPRPTYQNTRKRNTRVLIDIRDWYFQHEKHTGRTKALDGIASFIIYKLDTDDFYSKRCWQVLSKLLDAVNNGSLTIDTKDPVHWE
jgi:hypothetical protein